MFGLRLEGSEGTSMGELRQCPGSDTKCKGPEAETCLMGGRAAREASVAETASAQRPRAGEEVGEAGETRLDGALRPGFYSREDGKTLEGCGPKISILGSCVPQSTLRKDSATLGSVGKQETG